METDFDVKVFERREADDKNVFVHFYLHPVKDEEKSNEEGRPIFREVEFIEIRTPGSQTNIIRRPVRREERERFPQQYRRFKEGMEDQQIGTPLTEVPWITKSQVEELSFFRLRTVEHLATATDEVCSRFAGLYQLKQKAQAYLARAKEEAPMVAIAKIKEDLEAKIAAQEQTIKDQSALIQKLKESQK